jgi:hypothetical protein
VKCGVSSKLGAQSRFDRKQIEIDTEDANGGHHVSGHTDSSTLSWLPIEDAAPQTLPALRYKSDVLAFAHFTGRPLNVFSYCVDSPFVRLQKRSTRFFSCYELLLLPSLEGATLLMCHSANSRLHGGSGLFVCANGKMLVSFPRSEAIPMKEKLIRATELAEFVYCSKAWELKYLDGVEVSPEARELQAAANAWHIEKGRSLARGDSYQLAAFAALLLGAVLIVFCWLGWAK